MEKNELRKTISKKPQTLNFPDKDSQATLSTMLKGKGKHYERYMSNMVSLKN
jgi:hypothetical protein